MFGMFENEKKQITVQEKLAMLRDKEKQIETLKYERGLIEHNIGNQIKTEFVYKEEYNIFWAIVPDFFERASTYLSNDKKEYKNYKQDAAYIEKEIRKKLFKDNSDFKLVNIMTFGMRLGAPAVYYECVFAVKGQPNVKFIVHIPQFQNADVECYENLLAGTYINASYKDSGFWEFVAGDLEYKKTADGFAEWYAGTGFAAWLKGNEEKEKNND